MGVGAISALQLKIIYKKLLKIELHMSILSIATEIILSILRRLRHFFNNVLKYAERSEALRHPLVNIILYERIRMKLNLPDVTNSNSVSVINSNFTAIEQELQNKVLYRDNPNGEPNTLETALDANGQEIYNVGNLRTTNLYINGDRVVPESLVIIDGDDISDALLKVANLSDLSNPSIARDNIGLGNVNNTSDANKPVSLPTASALSAKQDTLVSGVNIKTVSGNSILGSGNIAVSSPWINVVDYGADKAGVADSASAFQSAVNALPATGGRIVVPDGNYVINTAPAIGSKSVYWDIGVGTVFTGSGIGPGEFPYVSSVGAQMSVGPLIRSQTSVHAVDPGGGFNAGVAALQIEMLQPDSYGAGNSLGAYIAATSNNGNTNGNSWALNTLIKVGPAATGTHQCIEIDVDLESSAALTKGVSISGIGTVNPDVAIEIIRGPAIGGTPYIQTYWERGIDVMTSVIGVQIRDTCSSGIAINNPGQTANTPISAKQRITNGDTLVLQRTNDGSTGNYIRGVNSANTANMFTIDGDGDSYFQNGVYAGYLIAYGGMGTANLTVTSPAGSVAAGYICIGNQVFGSAGGLVGYIEIFRGSTPYKIPYYTW